MKHLKFIATLGMFVALGLSTRATILLPGQSGLDLSATLPGGTIEETLITDYQSGNLNGFITTIVRKDPANPLGGLTFEYAINNFGPEPIRRLATANFGTVPVEVNTMPIQGEIAPSTADRSGGGVVGFNFAGPGLSPGGVSTLMVVNTSFQGFGGVAGSLIGVLGDSICVNVLGPNLVQTPEPATILAASLLLIPLGISILRIKRKHDLHLWRGNKLGEIGYVI